MPRKPLGIVANVSDESRDELAQSMPSRDIGRRSQGDKPKKGSRFKVLKASGRRHLYEGTEKVLKGRNNVAQGATDDKPRAEGTDDKPRAEGKLAFTMPRCEGGKAMKWINPVC